MKKSKILVAEDSRSARYALMDLLSSPKTEVVAVESGLSAQKTLRKSAFDLVITDIDMPGLDGLELCRWIKARPATKMTPVIVLSARETDQDIENGFRVGADAYVPKSMSSKELLPRIEAVMHRSSFVLGKTILVVDDSKNIREMAKSGLEAAGFQVLAVENGREALELARTTPLDLVLTDLCMPQMNGDTLCRTLLGMESFCQTPIIVMSSLADKSVMQRLVQDGVTAFIAKPFNIDLLNVTVERVLSDHFRLLLQERERFATERRITLASIASLVNALEARDAYTRGHSEAVAFYATGIARELGFEKEQLERLCIAGKLHDLGKIGVRDDVLNKPGSLTDGEYEHIKSHTTIVQDILDPLEELRDTLWGASSHHERWDGSGYPKGLKGEEIPLVARVIAVADVFDALTSDRPYRDSVPQEKAINIIVEGKGTHFCPEVVDAFVRFMGSICTVDCYKNNFGVVGVGNA